MNRLVKHFEHRVAVNRHESSASVEFPGAPCTMQRTGEAKMDQSPSGLRIHGLAYSASRMADGLC